jgi:hypothetical protein
MTVRVKKNSSERMPAFQFYPADWRKDPGVQALGFHDRGVWFEILCLMHESSERGVLLLNGHPMPMQALANILGLDNQTLNQTVTNLTTYGVAKIRDGDGALFSKRMVADEKLCKVRREAGKKGGNPALLNQKDKQTDIQGDNQNPTPSVSISSSVNSVTNVTDASASADLFGNESDSKARVEQLPTVKEQIWHAGKSLLMMGGTAKEQAGNFIGKLISDYGETAVLEAVRAGVSEQPADPRSYLKATCLRVVGERRPVAKPSRQANFSQTDYTKGFEQ